MNFIPKCLTIGLALLAMPLAAEAKTLDAALDEIAQSVNGFVKGRKATGIMVGDFEGPPTASSGRRIRDDLRTKLGTDGFGLTIPANALEAQTKGIDLRIVGEFSVAQQGGLTIVQIKARVVDARNEELTEFRERIVNDPKVDSPSDVATLLGSTVDLSSTDPEEVKAANDVVTTETTSTDTTETTETSTDNTVGDNSGSGTTGTSTQGATKSGTGTTTTTGSGTANTGTGTSGGGSSGAATQQVSLEQRNNLVVARNQAVGSKFAKPSFALIGNAIAASKTSPYRIEILIQRNGVYQQMPIQDAGGLAFAELQDGDVYAVRLINDSDIDVGVELLIDGLNSLSFSENPGFRQVGKWMIAARSSGVIKGWHRVQSRVNQFLVTPTPDSEIARLGKPTSSIGTVTAIFYPAWTGDTPPEIEKLLVANSSRSGTAKGPEVSTRIDTAVRHFGQAALAVVSVRYVNPEPPADLPEN